MAGKIPNEEHSSGGEKEVATDSCVLGSERCVSVSAVMGNLLLRYSWHED